MPTLTEDIALPGGVAQSSVRTTIQLWGLGGPVTGYEQGTAKTIAGVTTVDGNPWSIANVVANVDIDLPTGTVYRVTRSWPNQLDGPLVDYITMPSGGGPYRIDQVLTEVPTGIPTTAPSNEVDSFAPAANSANLAVNGLTFVPVPNFIVDVPDLDGPCLLLGWVNVFHTTVANAILYAGVAAVGVTALASTKGLGNSRAGAANVGVTVPFVGRLPAHSAGSYQVGVNGDAGNVVVVGGTNGITLLTALAV